MTTTTNSETTPALTMADVIEEERLRSGAMHLSLSLGPDATPEGVRAELARAAAAVAHYMSFSELEREKAKVARMKSLFRKITSATRHGIDASKRDLSTALSNVFCLSEMVPDADTEADVAWMEAQRQTKSAGGKA